MLSSPLGKGKRRFRENHFSLRFRFINFYSHLKLQGLNQSYLWSSDLANYLFGFTEKHISLLAQPISFEASHLQSYSLAHSVKTLIALGRTQRNAEDESEAKDYSLLRVREYKVLCEKEVEQVKMKRWKINITWY